MVIRCGSRGCGRRLAYLGPVLGTHAEFACGRHGQVIVAAKEIRVAMTAGFLGWFVCSLFASVAYNWTFYYLLALIVASREMVMARLRAARALVGGPRKTFSVPAQRVSTRASAGLL